MRKYKKTIEIDYKYVDSPESESALVEVFDDIFERLIKKEREIYSDFDSSTVSVFEFIFDRRLTNAYIN